MRSRELKVLRRGNELLEYTPEIMAFLNEPRSLIIAKANIHARVHRRVYLDYIGVKRFDAAGNLTGEIRIVGLFTSTAYTRTAHSIPYLRRKLGAVERRAGFDPASHSGKALANVLEHYPRDELFQVDEDTLLRLRAGDPATRRAAARARAGAARPLRSFRLGAGLRAARTLRQPYPREDRRISGARLHRAGVGLLSLFPGGRPAGARAFHHRPLRRRGAAPRSRRRSSAKSRPSSAPGATGCAMRWP